MPSFQRPHYFPDTNVTIPHLCLRMIRPTDLFSCDQLLKFGIIDEIIPEPLGGAHQDTQAATASLKEAVVRHFSELVGMETQARTEARYKKFRAMGEWNQATAMEADRAGA